MHLAGACGGDFCTSHLKKTGNTRWAHVPCPNHPRMILQNVLEVEEVQQISFDQETLHTPTSNICGSRAAQANWKFLIDSWLAIQPLPHPWQTCDLGISKFPRTTMEYPSAAAHSGTLQRRFGWHDDSPSWVLCSYAATAVHEAWQLRTLILPIAFQKQPWNMSVVGINRVFQCFSHLTPTSPFGCHLLQLQPAPIPDAKHRSKRRLRKSSANSSVHVHVFGLTSGGYHRSSSPPVGVKRSLLIVETAC